MSVESTIIDVGRRGLPKGGLGRDCLPSFADVLHALLSSRCCPPGCVVVCCYTPALLSGFAVNLNLFFCSLRMLGTFSNQLMECLKSLMKIATQLVLLIN
jgi:hypothetical protein